ncbi:hypothetical protein [Thioalkalivibrio sp. ALE14]|uniref:hypothetical protein n=1 Tax=Thioalkalivibrio sp. ALE14 TaxID=1158168 RepID=UPI00035CDC2C|nr:hypothetical protein [Thioalkalivibrio sp. ALE14]
MDHSNDNVPRTFIAALHRVLTFWPRHPLHRAVLLAVGGLMAWAVVVDGGDAPGLSLAVGLWSLWTSMAMNPDAAWRHDVDVWAHFLVPAFYQVLAAGLLAIGVLHALVWGWPAGF